jgi:hypothetical protein
MERVLHADGETAFKPRRRGSSRLSVPLHLRRMIFKMTPEPCHFEHPLGEWLVLSCKRLWIRSARTGILARSGAFPTAPLVLTALHQNRSHARSFLQKSGARASSGRISSADRWNSCCSITCSPRLTGAMTKLHSGFGFEFPRRSLTRAQRASQRTQSSTAQGNSIAIYPRHPRFAVAQLGQRGDPGFGNLANVGLDTPLARITAVRLSKRCLPIKG